MSKESPAQAPTNSSGITRPHRARRPPHAPAFQEIQVLAVLLVIMGCQRGVIDEQTTTTQSALTAPPTFTVTIQTPKGLSPLSVVLGSGSSVNIGAATTITRPGTLLATITNMGTGGVDAEPDAILGEVWSTSPVTLRDRVHVLGRTLAPSVVRGNAVRIDGGVDSVTPLVPPTITTWTVTYPGTASPNVVVPPNGSSTQLPGRFGLVQVSAGGTLSLQTGTYFLDSLDLEPNAKVILNQDSGPVLIYVRTSLILRGTFSAVSGSSPDLLLGYLGTAAIFAEAPFKGTIAAPFSSLTLRSVPGGHRGAFFGKAISVDPNTSVTYLPPQVILVTQPNSPPTCTAAIVPSDSLTGNAREVQYQQDILRYCTGTDISSCERTLRARMNVDFFMAAAMLYTNRVSTGTYAQVLRDRDAAIANFRINPTLACAVVAHDGDGDYIPDNADSCPNTPPLTPVLPNGCTNSQIATGPPINEVQGLIKNLGINLDPRCAASSTLSVPAPLGVWKLVPDTPSLGKAVWISRDQDVSGCPLYYQVEVVLTDGQGVRTVTFAASEDTTLSWIPRPSGAVQFNIHGTDPGDRGKWGNLAAFTRSYRVRAFNAGGQRSAWSDYFFAPNVDCVVGGPCLDR